MHVYACIIRTFLYMHTLPKHRNYCWYSCRWQKWPHQHMKELGKKVNLATIYVLVTDVSRKTGLRFWCSDRRSPGVCGVEWGYRGRVSKGVPTPRVNDIKWFRDHVKKIWIHSLTRRILRSCMYVQYAVCYLSMSKKIEMWQNTPFSLYAYA